MKLTKKIKMMKELEEKILEEERIKDAHDKMINKYQEEEMTIIERIKIKSDGNETEYNQTENNVSPGKKSVSTRASVGRKK